MPSIPGTLYVIRDDGEFEITHDRTFAFLPIIYSLLATYHSCATSSFFSLQKSFPENSRATCMNICVTADFLLLTVRPGSGSCSPLKRPRAESIASSCTLQNSTPASSEPDLQIIEPTASKPNTRPKPEVQIIDPPPGPTAQPRKNLDVPAPKRTKSNTSNLSDTKPTQTHQYLPAQATALDVDGFEDLKYGPGGIINLDDLEERFEAEFYGAASQIQARAPPVAARNLPICFPQEELTSFDVRGVHIKKGKTVEFLNGTFLKVAKIIKNTYTEEVVLRGWMLKRCSHMKGILPKKLNEVCFVLEVELDDPRPVMEQAMVKVGLDGVVKIRHVVSTNYPHPHLGFPRVGLPYDTKKDNMEYVKDYERLVVRWKFITCYDNAIEHARTSTLKYPINIRKTILVGLTEKDCTPGCFMDPALLRHEWRGETIIGGSGRMEAPVFVPPQIQESSDHAYECHQCGKGFNRAEKLLEHFQNTHERQSRRQPSHPRQRQARQPSVIEILEDDDDDGTPQRRRASREQIEDIRVRLSSVLSLDGEKINDNNKVQVIRGNGRGIDVDLTSPRHAGRRSNPRPERRAHGRIEAVLQGQNNRSARKDCSSYTYGDACKFSAVPSIGSHSQSLTHSSLRSWRNDSRCCSCSSSSSLGFGPREERRKDLESQFPKCHAL